MVNLKFRKKPVVIDAVQWNPNTMFVKDVLDSFGGLEGMNGIRVGKVRGELIIHTLEGDMTAKAGDYIIKGVKGEVYPCKPDIFQATYNLESDKPEPANPQIENNFKYHAPKPGQPEKYNELREKAKELAYLIDELFPASRERSIALTELETAVMWANASIARN